MQRKRKKTLRRNAAGISFIPLVSGSLAHYYNIVLFDGPQAKKSSISEEKLNTSGLIRAHQT